MTESKTQSQEVSGSGVRKGSRRTAKIVTVAAVVVVATVVISILAFTSTQSAHSTTPRSGLHLDTTNPPPNVPPYSVVIDFLVFTQNVSWSDLRIDLTDGVYDVGWYPSTEGLSGSAFISYCCGVGSLGSMTVTCNITDYLGDGIAKTGDKIILTAQSDATFLATQNYTISVIYIPDGGLVCSLTFNGVPLVVSTQ